MYKITEKVALNPTVTKMVIEAPMIAKKAKPGQFIIVRPFEDSERIPLTVAGYDREKGISFSSQSHFIQVFENFTGLTPKKYRDRYYKSMW